LALQGDFMQRSGDVPVRMDSWWNKGCRDRPALLGHRSAQRTCADGLGRALLFTLNRQHLAAPAVEILAGMRAELLRRIRASVGALEIEAAHVSLFGRRYSDTARRQMMVRAGTRTQTCVGGARRHRGI
jgi:hypothetical protein